MGGGVGEAGRLDHEMADKCETHLDGGSSGLGDTGGDTGKHEVLQEVETDGGGLRRLGRLLLLVRHVLLLAQTRK